MLFFKTCYTILFILYIDMFCILIYFAKIYFIYLGYLYILHTLFILYILYVLYILYILSITYMGVETRRGLAASTLQNLPGIRSSHWYTASCQPQTASRNTKFKHKYTHKDLNINEYILVNIDKYIYIYIYIWYFKSNKN